MKKINVLLFVIATLAVVTSCSKENRINKNLWKKDGVWKIEALHVKQTSTNSADNYEETVSNYGTMTFYENGSGKYTFTVQGDTETGTFTYTNTESELELIIDGNLRNFSIEEWEKDQLTISITENFTSSGESITYIETMDLKKQ
jgi:hypothetical protein